MKNEPLKICNAVIQPGEISSLALPMPEIFNYTPMYMPIRIIHGKLKGPRVLIMAAVHGNELNGTEIVHRLVNSSSIKKLVKGTLIVVPIFNVYGFLTRSRYLADGLELDQYFPGSETGSHAARVAHLFITEIFDQVDYCFDLRTGSVNHSNLPQIRTDTKNHKCLELSNAFRTPIICHIPPKAKSLRDYAQSKNIPYMQYEAGEPLRFNEQAIRIGFKGITNVLRHLEMIPLPKKTAQKIRRTFIAENTLWVRAPKSGVAYIDLLLGQQVKHGQKIAAINDPFGASENAAIPAPFDGIVIAKNNLPMVYEGETLIQLAQFKEHSQAIHYLEDWQTHSKKYSEEI